MAVLQMSWLVGFGVLLQNPVVSSTPSCDLSRNPEFRWTPKCEHGPSFSPKIKVTDVDLQQFNKSAKSSDGIDLTEPLKVILKFEPYQDTLTDPYMNMAAYVLIKDDKNSCDWQQVIDPSDTGDLNPCLVIDEDCTLKDHPTQLHMSIDLKSAIGDALDVLPANKLYAIEVTITDGKTPVYCFRTEQKVLKT